MLTLSASIMALKFASHHCRCSIIFAISLHIKSCKLVMGTTLRLLLSKSLNL